jgi:hypothetical protein
MKRPILFSYQFLIGISDTATGAMLIVAPALTLQAMRLHVAAAALPFLSFIGSFVLAVGLCCLYGAFLAYCDACQSRLKIVWLLTAIMRGSVAIYVFNGVLGGVLETGWVTVGIFDGACALIQAIGLRRGWLIHEAE